MRYTFLLPSALLAAGCGATCNGPARRGETPREAAAVSGLYTDAEVKRMTKHDPDAAALPGEGERFLGVVPNGETRPLRDVLKDLGIAHGRLQEPRYGMSMMVISLAWQVSPSYDLVCMAAGSPKEGKGAAGLFDPDGEVYGVQLLRRADTTGWFHLTPNK